MDTLSVMVSSDADAVSKGKTNVLARLKKINCNAIAVAMFAGAILAGGMMSAGCSKGNEGEKGVNGSSSLTEEELQARSERERLSKLDLKTGMTSVLTLPGGVKMEMIYVAPGSFVMGSDNGADDEKPAHKVTLTKGYWLGKCEVSQKQWKSGRGKSPELLEDGHTLRFFGENPSTFRGDNLPVDSVSWKECQRFLKNVSKLTKEQFGSEARLPTEAEWEYACRAGTEDDFSGPLDDLGWYQSNYRSANYNPSRDNPSHEIGTKKPNPWGFCDMHGNVEEWCNDWYSADYYQTSPSVDPMGPPSGEEKVLRGGYWGCRPRSCRSSSRDKCRGVANHFGLRICCSAEK